MIDWICTRVIKFNSTPHVISFLNSRVLEVYIVKFWDKIVLIVIEIIISKEKKKYIFSNNGNVIGSILLLWIALRKDNDTVYQYIEAISSQNLSSQLGYRRQVVNLKYANFGSCEYTRLSDSVRQVWDLKSTSKPGDHQIK